MSTNFNWDQFESLSSPNEKKFDWTQFEPEEQETSQSKFPNTFEEFLNSKTPEARDIRADFLTSATSMLGLPGDIASIFVGDNPLTSEKLREKSFEAFPSLAPQNEQEKQWDEGLSFIMGLATPGAPIKAGTKLIGKGISKAGGSAIAKSLKGKYRELYDVGKGLGIDEKALAPFRHGKISESTLKTIAKLGEDAKKGVKFAEDLASPFYQNLNEKGANIPLSDFVNRSVRNSLKNIVKEIEKSPATVKESKDVVNFLNEAVANLQNKPYTVESLMDLYRNMNKTVNWSSVRQAGKANLVNHAKDTVLKGIYGMSPRLGHEFSQMNKLYAGYKQLAKEVSPNKIYEYASKGGPLGAALISLMSGKDLESSLKTYAGLYFGKKALGKISAKLLTDPKWVGLKEQSIKMIKNGNQTSLPKLIQAIKNKAESEKIYTEDD